jgi:hydroxylamine reductase
VAKLQDLLIYTLKGISQIVFKAGMDVNSIPEANFQLANSLFMTITNANFDGDAIEAQIHRMIGIRDGLQQTVQLSELHDAATFQVSDRNSMLEKAASIGVLSTLDEDIRSLREMNIYGLKGMAAYTLHAFNLGKENSEIYAFMSSLADTMDDTLRR